MPYDNILASGPQQRRYTLGSRLRVRCPGVQGRALDDTLTERMASQAYLDKAKSLGGKTLVPPVEIPTGSFAWMQDPEGNTLGLWQPKK